MPAISGLRLVIYSKNTAKLQSSKRKNVEEVFTSKSKALIFKLQIDKVDKV